MVAAAGAGCPTVPFRDHGPRERSGVPGVYAGETPIEGRGLPKPSLVVAPDGGLTGALQHLTVLRHDVASDGTWELELGSAGGGTAAVVATLRYHLGAGLAFPLEAGEPVAVRFNQSTRGTGLVIWDERAAPALLVALAMGIGSGRDLGADVVAGLDPEPDFDVSHVAYSEVKLAASGCTEATEHFDLKVRIGDAAAWIPPGAIRRVTLGAPSAPSEAEPTHAPANSFAKSAAALAREELGTGKRSALFANEFDFVALDTSRPDPRFPPPSRECPSPAHVSWVLLRAAPGP